MRVLQKLWVDEAGVLLSAEAVVVGAVAAAGITAGVTTAATSVNEELNEFAFSIRSLDQSYCIPAQAGCGACTAGSSFTQRSAEESVAELREVARKLEAEQQQERGEAQKGETDRKRSMNSRKQKNRKKEQSKIE